MKAACLTLLVLATFAQGCRKTPCNELEPVRLSGSYQGGGSLGKDRMLDVTLKASTKQVVLSYRSTDGSQIKAFYRIVKRVKP